MTIPSQRATSVQVAEAQTAQSQAEQQARTAKQNADREAAQADADRRSADTSGTAKPYRSLRGFATPDGL